jgi:stearoyl-CoA desaturase (delta-9 desaturase)
MLDTPSASAGTTADAPANAVAAVAALPPPALRERAADERVNRLTSIPFIAVHVLPLLAIFTGVTWRSVVLCVVLYYVRMFCITAGYHRYFSHRSYRLRRFPQFLLALGGTSAVQKGPLWWAAHHRHHHRHSDGEADIHSPQGGFWWSHMGWIICDKYSHTDLDAIRDFAKYPELVWINKRDWIAPWTLGIACFVFAGWSGLLIGFVLSTVLLWHSTFTINSLAHVFGRRRYATEDTSRNSALLGLLTMGEGWHNNHHYHQASARQGFYWWEVDMTYYILKALSWVGIVRDIKVPSKAVMAANHIDDGSFDIGMFRKHWRQATRAVHAAQSSVGHTVVDWGTDAGEVLALRKASVESGLASSKESLETFVQNSLEHAEQLAKLTRKGHRELVITEGT